jgi:hypothetical protein
MKVLLYRTESVEGSGQHILVRSIFEITSFVPNRKSGNVSGVGVFICALKKDRSNLGTQMTRTLKTTKTIEIYASHLGQTKSVLGEHLVFRPSKRLRVVSGQSLYTHWSRSLRLLTKWLSTVDVPNFDETKDLISNFNSTQIDPTSPSGRAGLQQRVMTLKYLNNRTMLRNCISNETTSSTRRLLLYKLE